MRYLSDNWLRAADEAVRAASPAPMQLVVEQHVEGVGGWRVILDSTCSVEPVEPPAADGPRADAIFRQSEATARAIARGETDAHQALLLGSVRFEGDIDRIIEHRGALVWLHQVLAPVMASTIWE